MIRCKSLHLELYAHLPFWDPLGCLMTITRDQGLERHNVNWVWEKSQLQLRPQLFWLIYCIWSLMISQVWILFLDFTMVWIQIGWASGFGANSFFVLVCMFVRGQGGYPVMSWMLVICEGVDFLTCEPGGPHVQGACLTSYANDVYVLHTVLSIPLRK